MKRLLIDLTWWHLDSLGAFEPRTSTSAVLPMYSGWFRECARLFELEGYLVRRGENFTRIGAPKETASELWRRWETEKVRWLRNPDLAATHTLLEATLRALPDILTGKKAATEVIFPNSSLTLVQNAYNTIPLSAFFNDVLAAKVVEHLRQLDKRAPRILEIGAGTGATSTVVLRALRESGLPVGEYCYTDISKAFLNHAEQSYGPANRFLTFRILNIENSVREQGIDAGAYDIVIAANVLHATRNIRRTLRNTQSLLAKRGLLLLNELTANNLVNHLTFGLLEGWWLYEDAELRLTGCPGLSIENWRRALEAEGYTGVVFPCLDAAELGQQIILAEGDGRVERPENSRAVPPTTAATIANGVASRSTLKDGIEQTIASELAKALRIDRERIRFDEPFSTYGLDSILAVQLTRSINEVLGTDLDITVMFEHNTVDALREHIASATVVSSVPERELPLASEGYAIIGMSGRFPQASDIEAFWHVVARGQSTLTTPPMDREDWAAGCREGESTDTMWGGFLTGVHEFDPLFFGISMTEARQMTPEQRLMLMAAWNVLEDAGYTPRELGQSSTGVFIAAGSSEYQHEGPALGGAPNVLSAPSPSMIPNRISYALNLHGPSEHCETTCSSSLVALHRAIQSIRLGECAQAIVGGINLIASPSGFAELQSAGMLSKRGKVRPFQEDAEGTVRGEGAGAILIKPVRRAIDDGDFIYAIVRGTGVGHGGKGVSFTAPNVRGMKAAIAQAYREAGVDPGTVSYIEAHGMSAPIADSTEIAALHASYSANGSSPIYVGTLKPCIGHTEVFSGLAALMKVVLALRHGTIPAIPCFGRLHPNISLAGSRLRMATETMPWPAPITADGRAQPRRASINSFGIGGVNAHVVLEEHAPPRAGVTSPTLQILPLSAKDESGLQERIQLLLAWLNDGRDVDLADVAYTLQRGREAMDVRAAVVGSTPAEVIERLSARLAGEPVSYGAGAEGAMAKDWVAGAEVDWSVLHAGARRTRVPLPTYPFKRVNCWQGASMRSIPPRAVPTPAASKGDVAASPEWFIVSLTASVLGLDAGAIDRTKPLEHYGMNSLLLVAMLGHVRSAFPSFQPAWLQAHHSLDDVISRMASVARDGARWTGTLSSYPELVHLNRVTSGRPVFWIHGGLGGVETFRTIAERSGRPFYAIQARGFMTKDAPIEGIPEMASYYIDIIQSVQKDGPYDVGGFCLGGIISYEITRQLQLRGHDVSTLVMVDSPDPTGGAKSNARGHALSKNAALQVANILLWPADGKDLAKVSRRLIHQNEIDDSLDQDEFVQALARLGVQRGLSMPHAAIVEFIQRNVDVQVAYGVGHYVIAPLVRPNDVECTYFRNARGSFFGALASYFTVRGETFSLDRVNYWQDWQREMPKLRMLDIDATNHMTILYEDGPLRAITQVCEELYSAKEFDAR
ncbi:thioesterase domain-containing protein [Pendulispora brunnea]|uniref:Thioesterase domain-containing protein n=1 Tax=Pendulispora brunnea TaxID=2905690 RepID=A0ABZ2KKP1_9BACT